jgi:hypothetical protein
MGSLPRAARSSWRSRTRGCSSASTRPTGTAELVDLGNNADLSSVDGLELQGRTLNAVRNTNVVTVVRLDSQLAAGTVLGDITNPRLLDVPTTATVAAGRLWVVNARFGTGPTPTTLVSGNR